MNNVKLITLAIFISYGTVELRAQSLPNAILKTYYQELHDWLKDTAKVKFQLESFDATPLDSIFNWQEIARRTFAENWVNLSGGWQKRYTQAIRKRIMKKTAKALKTVKPYLMEKNIRWEDEIIKKDKARTGIDIMRMDDIEKINIRLLYSEDAWKIYDVRTDYFRLIRDLLGNYDDMISNGYSHEYVEAMILESDVFVIDDFNSNESGDYPKLWGWRKKDDDRMRANPRLYFIQEENGDAYLSAQSNQSSIALVKPFSYNIKDYPFLSWRWRVKAFPATKTSRSEPVRVAEVVVIFYQNWIGIPMTLHYIWDQYSSPCTTIRQEGLLTDTYHKVIRTESGTSDEWFTENVNPFEDYRRIFGVDPPEQIVGMFILTESDQPTSNAKADYDDFVVKKSVTLPSCSK